MAKYYYEVEDTSIAELEGTKLALKSVGETYLCGYTDSSKKTRIFRVKVTVTPKESQIPVAQIIFSKSTYTLGTINGPAFAAQHTIFPSNATNKSVTLTSSDNDIVHINKKGLAETWHSDPKAGTATITAVADDGFGATATCTVVVKKQGTSVDSVYPSVINAPADGGEYHIEITRHTLGNYDSGYMMISDNSDAAGYIKMKDKHDTYFTLSVPKTMNKRTVKIYVHGNREYDSIQTITVNQDYSKDVFGFKWGGERQISFFDKDGAPYHKWTNDHSELYGGMRAIYPICAPEAQESIYNYAKNHVYDSATNQAATWARISKYSTDYGYHLMLEVDKNTSGVERAAYIEFPGVKDSNGNPWIYNIEQDA